MTAGCARCGACCDPVPFSAEKLEAALRWSTAALDGVPSPEDDWPHWLKHGWPEEQKDQAAVFYDPAGKQRENADFIAAHWKPLDDRNCACDAYDPETFSCTAHDTRPPVCRDYPWYGREPADADRLPKQCSYLADVPPDRRPEGARPLIPVSVL